MIMLTMIARVVDGLILVGSIEDEEQSRRNVLEYQNQAKQLFRKLSINSPLRCSIETGPYVFHYLIEDSVCSLTLCERAFSGRRAFAYLEQISREFLAQYGRNVRSVSRPYSFIDFDKTIHTIKKSYAENRVRHNLNALQGELQDVQRIMIENIDDVLQRGSALSDLDNKATGLSLMSKKYRSDARSLNLRSMYAKVVAVGIVVLVFFLYFWVL